MGKYDSFIKQLVEGNWAILGSNVSSALIDKYGVNPENARKIIQRTTEKGIMISSTPLTFGKGQFLYTKPGNYFGLEMVKEASSVDRKPLYRLLEVLGRIGMISFYEGLKITASPEEIGSTKISLLTDMISDLEKLGIVSTKTDVWDNNFLFSREAFPPMLDRETEIEKSMEKHLHEMKLDAVLLPDIMRWLRKINLIDSGATYRNVVSPANGVKVNEIFWDAYAYTKTTGINPSRASESNDPEKQTLVVLDVIISRKYLQADLDGFLARIQINLNSVKEGERKVLPVIVFNEIEEITLNRARKLGFVSFDAKTIFGTNISTVIQNFKVIFEGKEPQLAEIEPALEAIAQSGHIDELRSLRGALFEALMHPVIKRFYPNAQVLQSRKLKSVKKNKIREFDLIFISSHPKEILLVELKGYTGKSFIPLGSADIKDTLRYFFRGSVPVAQDLYSSNNTLNDYQIKTLYVTTGEFHSDTKNFIAKVNKSAFKPSQFDICIDGNALEKLLADSGFEHERQVIKKHFLRTPENIEDQPNLLDELGL